MELVLINSPSTKPIFKDLYKIFEDYFGSSSEGLIEKLDEEFDILTDINHYTRPFCVAAIENDQVLGGIGFEYYEQFNCAWIEHIAVIQNQIGKGIGTTLLNFALQRIRQECESRGKDQNNLIIFAETDNQKCSFNYNSLRLYSLGFRKLDLKYTLCPFFKGGPYLNDSLFLLAYKPELQAGLQSLRGTVSVPSESIRNIVKSWMIENDEDMENEYFKAFMDNIDEACIEGSIPIEEMFPFTQSYGPSKNGNQVIIIGGGISGLSAAADLIKNGRNVIILEAQNYFGGRSKSITSVDGFPKVDMGCEFLPNKDSKIKMLADSCGWEYEHMYSSVDDIDVFIDSKFSKYSNFALNNKDSSVADAIRLQQKSNMSLRISYDSLVSHLLKKCIFADKRLDWEVESINWKDSNEGNKVEVTCNTPKGTKTLLGTEVIVTVPLQILKDREIKFNPILPDWKEQAINKCSCNNSVKIVCRFKTLFWQPHHRVVIAPLGFFKQLWFYSIQEKEKVNNCYVAVGFATADVANKISSMPTEKIAELFLDQLDKMYRSIDSQHPATRSYLNHEYIDWSKIRSIRCGYSYENHYDVNAVSNLSKSVDGKLYFAGEATSEEDYGTAEGAMLSGKRVAAEISNDAS